MNWIQLTWTAAIFSRITLVSSFCAENQLSGKILENVPKILFHQKTHGARRRDGGGPRGPHTTWPRGLGQATPGGGVASSVTPLTSLFAYKLPLDLKTKGGSMFFQREFRYAATTRFRDSEQETPLWHPAGMANWRRSSPSSSPSLLHGPSMFPPSMSE